jgi:predicted nucleic acid-binding protein
VIVIDASALVKALVDRGPSGEAVRARMAGETISAPEHVDVEVLAVLRGLALAGKLPEKRAEHAVRLQQSMPIRRVPLAPHLTRGWELRQNFSAYDALYVSLAEVLDCPLLTSDRRLAKAAGARCVIEVFE